MIKKRLTAASLGIATMLLCIAQPISSFAASKINSIKLTIDSDIKVGDTDSEVDVRTSSSYYEVSDVTVTNSPSDEWDEGDKPKLKVTLTTDGDDYYFASGTITKSKVTLSGDDGTVTSVTRHDSETLYVYITLDKLEETGNSSDYYDLTVSDLEWNESNGKASWDGADDANKYEVQIYRSSTKLNSSTLTTTSTSYSFARYFTQSGYYSFRVRAVYSSNHKGSWKSSESFYVNASEAADIYSYYSSSSGTSSSSTSGSSGPGSSSSSSGAWLKDNVGWWYCNADRSYTTNGWQYINNIWYYFNESGYMVTGWVNWKNVWYYCDSSGAMLTNATTPDGYYVGSDGAWVS